MSDPPASLAAGAPGRRLRPVLLLGLRIVLSVGLFAAALWLAAGQVAWGDISALGPGTLLLCLGLTGLILWFMAWRWRFVLARFSRGDAPLPGIGAFIRWTWVGLAVNQLLPSVVAGDAVRASLLVRSGAASAGTAGISVLADRLYGLAGLVLLGLCGVPALSREMLGPTALVAAFLGLLILAALLAARLAARARSRFAELRQGVSLRTVLLLVPLSAAGHLANMGMFLAIAYALGVDLPIYPALAVLSAVLLLSVLPISVAGWGLREFTLVQAFGYTGLEPHKIVLSSVVYGFVLLLTQALGFLLILRRRP